MDRVDFQRGTKTGCDVFSVLIKSIGAWGLPRFLFMYIFLRRKYKVLAPFALRSNTSQRLLLCVFSHVFCAKHYSIVIDSLWKAAFSGLHYATGNVWSTENHVFGLLRFYFLIIDFRQLKCFALSAAGVHGAQYVARGVMLQKHDVSRCETLTLRP